MECKRAQSYYINLAISCQLKKMLMIAKIIDIFDVVEFVSKIKSNQICFPS